MNKLFKADDNYLHNMHKYTLKDTCIAIIFYVVNLIALYIEGNIYYSSGKYYGIYVSFIFIAIIFVIAILSHSSVGLNLKTGISGIIVGLLLGLIFIGGYTIIPGIITGARLLPTRTIAYNIFYYFIVIAFEEELSFRGFIQPRLYPLLKKEWITLLIGGILFVLMHYPFQMASRGMGILEYFPLFIAGAPIQLFWHYIFSWLYRKFGNIFGGSILHGFVDLSMGIFG